MPSSQDPFRHERPLGGSWIFYLLTLILTLTPLPFGAIYQWSWAGLALLVALLLLISTPFYLAHTRTITQSQKNLWLPALLFFLVVAWAALQASDLTPDSWDHPVWAQTSLALEESVPGTISLNPYATRSECLKMLTYAGVFWLAVVYGRDRKRARGSLWILTIAGCLYAVYGLAAFLTELGSTLWLQKMPQAYAGVSSTFVNRNMYVDYAAFGLLAAVCLILSYWPSRSGSVAEKHGTWRDFVVGKDSYVLLLCAMGLILLAALTMTGSRGGVLASVIAVGALIVLSLRRLGIGKTARKQSLVIGLVLVALVALVYALAGSHLGSRFVETTPETGAGRLAGYQMLVRAIGEAPFTGFGAGNSLDVFYLHNDGSMWKAFNYAHNIYLGAVVELGLPAAAALITAVGLVAFHCLRGVNRRSRDLALPALGVGATLLVAIHGLFDSPLYLTANAATFSFLLGLAYAQSWPTRSAVPSWKAEDSLGQTDRALQEPPEARIE